MQNNHSGSERYVRGFFRNTINNVVAGLIIGGIIAVIYLLTACEQPELKQADVPSMKDSTMVQDSIESWGNDTTIYHSNAEPM